VGNWYQYLDSHELKAGGIARGSVAKFQGRSTSVGEKKMKIWLGAWGGNLGNTRNVGWIYNRKREAEVTNLEIANQKESEGAHGGRNCASIY